MKVFLSWSGVRSEAVAVALNELLPSMIHPISCWMSDGSIVKGRPWFNQLKDTLDQIVFGIFCVTPENENAVWVQWEAGFLSSKASIGERHVAPLAIGMSKGALGGPFSVYQSTDTTREDIFRLVQSINGALPEERKVAESTLIRTFAYIWPDLESRIAAAIALPSRAAPTAPRAEVNDQLANVLALLREGQRESAETQELIRALTLALGAQKQAPFSGSDPTLYLQNSGLAAGQPIGVHSNLAGLGLASAGMVGGGVASGGGKGSSGPAGLGGIFPAVRGK